ncbi:SDR family NAD(P)-dependent oxidoreductase [Enterococcus sp. UD-01]|jgi:NAD(P)-dependent dehydrogenase (short-subunit alcohol dehydrogenase family)|uniref:SDR family NAD(P)-dependent oxidoreductase n=1 Tax=Enterococcus sp. UD-01 TaxID=3373911 RepID=UPI0038362227
MKKLSNKVVLIIESNSSIGHKTALFAAQEGATVICTARQQFKAEVILAEILKNGGTGLAITHNPSSLSSWKKLITTITRTYGTIDVMVNNAGISSPKLILDTTAADWFSIQANEINSIVYGLEAVLPIMLKNGGGSIVHVASILGYQGENVSPYNAAQERIRSLIQRTSIDFAVNNVRINSICPNTIETPLIEFAFPEKSTHYRKSVPFASFGKPENIANSIIYLACDESSFITGAELVIDIDSTII